MNPYSGVSFFGFFAILFQRLLGKIPLQTLPSDEIQLLTLLFITSSMVILGVFLSLRKMTMLANSLSHTTLLGIVICFLALGKPAYSFILSPVPLILSSLISAILTLTLTEITHKLFKLQEDAAIGLVFTTLFALSILLVTAFTRNTHIGIEIITGNVDALTKNDLTHTFFAAVVIILVTRLYYRSWVVCAFDPQFAALSGAFVKLHHFIQLSLTAFSLVISMRAVGVLLALSFLIGPVLIAHLFTKKVSSLIYGSLLTSTFFCIIGVALSRHILSCHDIAVSTGGLIVTLLSTAYLLCAALTFRQKAGLMTNTFRKNEGHS